MWQEKAGEALNLGLVLGARCCVCGCVGLHMHLHADGCACSWGNACTSVVQRE